MSYPPPVVWFPVLSKLLSGIRARADTVAEMPFGPLRMNDTMREMADGIVSTTETLTHVQRLVQQGGHPAYATGTRHARDSRRVTTS